jgi:DNA-directed RNA polymerase subunit RPC12/RpoP
MLAFCTRCWSEISARDVVCPECGARVEDDPRSFEQKLVAALAHPLPETRARICWVLGRKKAGWAVPHLLHALADRDLFVRVAALRALGETGDESAVPALERAAADESKLIRIVARTALCQIRARESA